MACKFAILFTPIWFHLVACFGRKPFGLRTGGSSHLKKFNCPYSLPSPHGPKLCQANIQWNHGEDHTQVCNHKTSHFAAQAWFSIQNVKSAQQRSEKHDLFLKDTATGSTHCQKILAVWQSTLFKPRSRHLKRKSDACWVLSC